MTGALQAQHAPIAPTASVLSSAAGLRLPQTLALHSYRQAVLAEAPARRPSQRQGEILMIVGGAVILTGLLVDEGLIAIAGAAIGGYGLYVYLRASDSQR
ncbi:MAG: hypothetical protein ACREMZ_13215 [Gemmatimonadales bacterium]